MSKQSSSPDTLNIETTSPRSSSPSYIGSPTGITDSLPSILDHPDVIHTIESSKYFKSDGSTHAFWANDVDRNPDGSVKTHHGREMALHFQASHPKKNVRLMQNYEGTNGIFVLDEYEKRKDVPKPIIDAVGAFSSISFAKNSGESVVTSVKGASISSYFRTVELPVIMRCEHISKIHNISREDPEGVTYPKKEAYHVLRDEWLESSKKRFLNVEIPEKTASEAQKAVYNSALKDFASEIATSRYLARDGKHPFGLDEHAKYTKEDKEIERERWKKCQDLVEELKVTHPDLEAAVKKEFYSKMRKDMKKLVKEYSEAIKADEALAKIGKGRLSQVPRARRKAVALGGGR